jgi:hypothetical protein
LVDPIGSTINGVVGRIDLRWKWAPSGVPAPDCIKEGKPISAVENVRAEEDDVSRSRVAGVIKEVIRGAAVDQMPSSFSVPGRLQIAVVENAPDIDVCG